MLFLCFYRLYTHSGKVLLHLLHGNGSVPMARVSNWWLNPSHELEMLHYFCLAQFLESLVEKKEYDTWQLYKIFTLYGILYLINNYCYYFHVSICFCFCADYLCQHSHSHFHWGLPASALANTWVMIHSSTLGIQTPDHNQQQPAQLWELFLWLCLYLCSVRWLAMMTFGVTYLIAYLQSLDWDKAYV